MQKRRVSKVGKLNRYEFFQSKQKKYFAARFKVSDYNHSMARANQNKSEKLVTNSPAEVKEVKDMPMRFEICIN